MTMKKNNDLINEFQALDPKSMNMDKIKEVKTKYKSLFAKAIIAKVEKAQAKKDTTANQAKPTKELKAVKNSFKYPFILHIAGRNIETDYIFEPGKEYTENRSAWPCLSINTMILRER
jgi:hypothetical protein